MPSNSTCVFCGGTHSLKKCEEFTYLAPDDRKKFVMENGRCLLCLGSGHIAEKCYSSGRCTFCFGKHHSLIHVRRLSASNLQPSDLQRQSETNTGVTSLFQGYINSSQLWSTNRRHAVSVAFVVAALRNPITQETILVNVLLDSGANNSSITQKVADILLLSGERENYILEVSGGDLKKYNTIYCHVQVGNPDGANFTDLGVRVLPHPCGSLQYRDWNKIRRHFPHFGNSPIHAPVNRGRVDMILGTDAAGLMAACEPDHIGDPLEPILRKTVLGYVAMGSMGVMASGPSFASLRTGGSTFVTVETLRKEEHTSNSPVTKREFIEERRKQADILSSNMSRIFDIERPELEERLRNAPPTKRVTRKQVDLVEAFYEQVTLGNPSSSGLLWNSPLRPASNLNQAKDLYERSEKYRDEEENNAVQKIVDEYLSKHYVVELDWNEAEATIDCFIIPSFVVCKVDGTKKKYRLVFNAARPFCQGALNDFLRAGPHNGCDLVNVLLKFRKNRYCYNCGY